MTSIKSLLRLALVAVGLLFSTAAFALCGTGSGTCYWVGGGSSTNWSATSNTNWSLVSGGANNAGPPVTGDTVVFDANSGTGTSNISASTWINRFLYFFPLANGKRFGCANRYRNGVHSR